MSGDMRELRHLCGHLQLDFDARALAQNAHPDSLHWDHRPGETQRGDTTGRKKGGNIKKEQNEKCHFYSL